MLGLHTISIGEPDNPPLIILHGLFGSHTNWRTLSKAFAQSHFVYLVDLRNHGQSPWDSDMSYSEMAGDVQRFIETHKLIQPAIVGHSMGGKVAMALAQATEAMIAKLIIADISPVPYTHSHDNFISAMKQVNFDQVTSRKDVDLQLQRDIPSAPIRQFLQQNLTRIDDQYRWRINLEAIEENLPKLLDYNIAGKSDVETLFIGGSLSDYISPAHHADIQRLFPNSSIQTIDQAGHWLHAEKPREFVDLVQRFLKPSDLTG